MSGMNNFWTEMRLGLQAINPWYRQDCEMKTANDLRLAVESAYKSVSVSNQKTEEVSMSGFGGAKLNWTKNLFEGIFIFGTGLSEGKAVMNAYNAIRSEIGGEELIWIRLPKSVKAFDDRLGRSIYGGRGLAMVR